MATLHKILFGSALLALAGVAQAQGSPSTMTTGPAAGVAAPVPVDNASGSSASGSGSATSGIGAAGTTAAPIATPAPAGATSTPSAGTSTDPYVQRREARKQAKAEYKDKKRAAKQEYKEDKREANAALKASRNEPGVQRNVGGTQSSGR